MPKRLRRRTRRLLKFAAMGAGVIAAVLMTAFAVDASESIRFASPVDQKVQEYYNDKVAAATMPPAATVPPVVKTVTYAAYGDSITEGDSPDFANGEFGSLSWASYTGQGIEFAGGWAVGGVKSETILENAKPVTADALVLVVGANDYMRGVPFEQTAANITGLVQRSKVERVIISSLPPRDKSPDLTVEFNAKLQRMAKAQRWHFVDGAAGVRAGDVYAPGMSIDGVHPTAEAARRIGQTLRTAILQP